MVAVEAAPYLLALRLHGRRVLVVGGGAVASRRVPALLDAGAAEAKDALRASGVPSISNRSEKGGAAVAAAAFNALLGAAAGLEQVPSGPARP